MTSTLEPKAIANYFIEAALAEGKKITPLQVIKLTYIAHGWHLALTDQPLLNEPPEAWQYGPVIPSLYHALKKYGNGAVTETLTEYCFVPEKGIVAEKIPSPPDPNTRQFLDSVWRAYNRFSGSQLSTMTHQPKTPWHQTWEEKGAKYTKGVDIPENLIRDHYKELNLRYAPKPPGE